MDKYVCEFEAATISEDNKNATGITNICIGMEDDFDENYLQILVGDESSLREFHLVIEGTQMSVFKPWSDSKVESLLDSISLPQLKDLTRNLKVRRPNKVTLIKETMDIMELIYTDMLTGKSSLDDLKTYFKKGTVMRDMCGDAKDTVV